MQEKLQAAYKAPLLILKLTFRETIKAINYTGGVSMKKIKDRILLGVISGLLGALPADSLNKIEYNLGLTDRKYNEMTSSLVTAKNKSKTGKILGTLANETLIITCSHW